MSSFKFAVITDTHLGYEEKDQEIQKDSFEAFNEALDIAEKEEVDFILHAGDLFDSTFPSPSTLVQTNEILFKHKYLIPNDENSYKCTDTNGEIDVKFPIFAINGNHDQPTGNNLTSACEILSSCHLIYYFEKSIGNPNIQLKPIYFNRDNLTIAVYGLHYILKDRFISLLKNTVDMTGTNPTLIFDDPPREDEDDTRKRFNILLIHQDRHVRTSQSIDIPLMLSKICPWMNLIIWGHEHDNKTTIENIYNLNIIQPGSTIITQYRKYEEPKRGFYIIEISSDRDEIQFRNIELETPRTILYKELNLNESFNLNTTQEKEELIRNKIKELIDQNTNRNKHPIVRLSIITKASIVINDVPYKQICYEFADKVANPNTIFVISRRSNKSASKNKNTSDSSTSDPKGLDFSSSSSSVAETLTEYFNKTPLEILHIDTLNQSLTEFITQKNKDVFKNNINKLINNRVEFLVNKIPKSDDVMSINEVNLFIEKNKPNFP